MEKRLNSERTGPREVVRSQSVARVLDTVSLQTLGAPSKSKNRPAAHLLHTRVDLGKAPNGVFFQIETRETKEQLLDEASRTARLHSS